MYLLLSLVRIVELTVATLVITWALNFRSSFTHSTAAITMDTRTSQLDHLYSVLHPLLMVIGFIVLTGEGKTGTSAAANRITFGGFLLAVAVMGVYLAAIMAHRWLERCSRGTRKLIHLLLQGSALGFGLMGIWAKFHGERGIVANFYSLHSWMGLLCLALFFAQWVVGFMSFWHRGEGRRARQTVLPWHVFIGLYTYVLAVSTAESGLLEKLTFLQGRGKVATRSMEASLVNGLGLGLALLGGIVVFSAVSPKKQATATKVKAMEEDISGLSKNGYGYGGADHHQIYLNGKLFVENATGKRKSGFAE